MSQRADSSVPVVGRLALEDGTVFRGSAFGACSEGAHAGGEVVFNTALTGYQEALTDPSYSGQILTMTAPEMGNYGVSKQDWESATIGAAAFVVRELIQEPSTHRAHQSLSAWLAEAGVPGIQGIDTRALVRKLRTQGALRGVVWVGESPSDSELVDKAKALSSMTGQNLAGRVSPTSSSTWTQGMGEWTLPGQLGPGARRFKVVALDCGAKHNIFRNLTERGCDIEVVPHDFTAAEVRARKPDGLFISNGPGDPAAVGKTIATLREIAGEVPTFGICLGHQLLALALGAKTWKLKFGHRGANQPVKNLFTGRVEITSQNHGFCVDESSLREAGGEPTHTHLNDGTLAGFRHTTKPIFSVQYHPEASPGPHDSAYLFDCFITMMQSRRPISAADMESAQRALTAV